MSRASWDGTLVSTMAILTGTGPPWAPLHPNALQPPAPAQPPLCVPPVWVQPLWGAGWGAGAQLRRVPAPPCCAGRIVLGEGAAFVWRAAGGLCPHGAAWLPGLEHQDQGMGSGMCSHPLPLRSCCCHGVYCRQLSPRALHPTPCFSQGEQ